MFFGGASLFTLFGFILSELFLGIPLLTQPGLLDNLSDPELIPALRLMQVLQAFGMLILPSLAYLWLTSNSRDLKRVFGMPKRQPVLISITFFMVALPAVNFISEWNASWEIPTFIGEWITSKESKAGALTESFLEMPSWIYLAFNLFMIALLPAVGEELIFRGVLQRGLQRINGNPHLSIWVAAILFSAMHMQFLGFFPRLLMGVAMGYLLYWSGNLWYPIIAHFTNNAMAVILAYGIQHGSIQPEIENAGIGNGTLAIFSVLFCGTLLYLFKHHQLSINRQQ